MSVLFSVRYCTESDIAKLVCLLIIFIYNLYVFQIIKETGFLSGLYTDDELSSDNIKDKESKVAFLQKCIDATGMMRKVCILKLCVNMLYIAVCLTVFCSHKHHISNFLLQLLH